MDLDRFKECSAAFGAERRRWPQREHALYDRFANTPEGMAILAEAGRTDRFLDALEPALPDPRRARQIGALARPAWRRLGKPAAALAASAALGFVVGLPAVARRHRRRRRGSALAGTAKPTGDRAVIAWLRSTRGLTVLLAASLGANLFLGGMVAGRITGDVTQGSPTRRSIEAMLAPLPDAKRKLVRQEIDAAMPQSARAARCPAEGTRRACRGNGQAHTGQCVHSNAASPPCRLHTTEIGARVAAGHHACTAGPDAGRAPRLGAGAGAAPGRWRAALDAAPGPRRGSRARRGCGVSCATSAPA